MYAGLEKLVPNSCFYITEMYESRLIVSRSTGVAHVYHVYPGCWSTTTYTNKIMYVVEEAFNAIYALIISYDL